LFLQIPGVSILVFWFFGLAWVFPVVWQRAVAIHEYSCMNYDELKLFLNSTSSHSSSFCWRESDI
jgi:hypothetical protein